MAKRKGENGTYQQLKNDLRNGKPGRIYAFWGEERYLLEHYLGELRRLVPAGTEEFNHRRLDGRILSVNDLQESIDALPVFSDFTLTEINDFDFSKINDQTRQSLVSILSDVPDYACVVFVFDTVEFKLDGRIKANASLKKMITSVEFARQDQNEIVVWIARHFKADGKKIDRDTAEYLAFITGGMMTDLSNEIEKLVAYSRGETITKADVDAVVIPVLDAAAYELTDAILSGKRAASMEKLGELFAMGEPPHKILFSISMKLRQLLCAKACILSGVGIDEFMKMCSVRYEFQAKSVLTSAKRLTLSECRNMVTASSNAAYVLNSSAQEPEEVLKELIVRLLTMDCTED